MIVTSAFPPTMLADVHRARMLACELPQMGWDVEVLTPGTEYQRSIWVEPAANALRPPAVVVHEAPLFGAALFRLLTMQSVGWRSFWPMYRLGVRLLRSKRFDLVYFSTTQFSLFCLGRLWRKKVGVPYVLDIQDPLVRDSVRYATTAQGLKFRINERLIRWIEKFTLSRAAGLVAVSPVYLDEMSARHPAAECLRRERRAVIPFAATLKDLAWARPDPSCTDGTGPLPTLEIVYVGAGGSIMSESFRRIARALRRIRATHPQLVDRVRIRLVGTYAYWKPSDPKVLEAIARDEGIGALVDEAPARVSYLHAMQHALRARGLLILGVNDRAYMPSKLFTYALTGKPLLASLHPDSQANAYFRAMPTLGRLVHFGTDGADDPVEDAEVVGFLEDVNRGTQTDRAKAIDGYLSDNMARHHATLFEACLRPGR